MKKIKRKRLIRFCIQWVLFSQQRLKLKTNPNETNKNKRNKKYNNNKIKCYLMKHFYKRLEENKLK